MVLRSVRLARRTLATAAAAPPHAHVPPPSASRAVPIPLANLEAQWERMAQADQVVVYEQLEELQKKSWKDLSLAEKKAGACRCAGERVCVLC
jgi:cytochrome c oxidase subunit 4